MLEQLTLSPNAIVTIINRVPLFKLLSEQDKRDFLRGKPEVFIARAGDVISKNDSFDKAFYILVSGAAKSIQKQSESNKQNKNAQGAHVETMLQAGDFIGEVAFCTSEPDTSDVVAVRDTVLMKINRNCMLYLPLMVKDKIKNNIIKDLAGQISEVREENAKLQSQFDYSNSVYSELKAEVEDLRNFVSKINQEYPHIKRRYELLSFSA